MVNSIFRRKSFLSMLQSLLFAIYHMSRRKCIKTIWFWFLAHFFALSEGQVIFETSYSGRPLETSYCFLSKSPYCGILLTCSCKWKIVISPTSPIIWLYTSDNVLNPSLTKMSHHKKIHIRSLLREYFSILLAWSNSCHHGACSNRNDIWKIEAKGF